MTFKDTTMKAGWVPQASSAEQHPHMTRAFANAYEQAATRITGPVSCAVLDMLTPLNRETEILDIGAGTGAFSVPAAHEGATVTAIDIAPGMIEVLAERLSPFPRARALRMDGQRLDFNDGGFDAAVSVFGISLFPDWRLALAEQVRVLRPGGRAVLATWRRPPGGGPFVIMTEALRAAFPDQAPPTPPGGFLELAAPGSMQQELANVGLGDVSVGEIEAVWEGPAGAAYLEELKGFHRFMGPYALLEADARARLDEALLEAVERNSNDGRVRLESTVTLGVGIRR
jgi:ubiquinone/menaquinone biosynthesis C-methylase UbiE